MLKFEKLLKEGMTTDAYLSNEIRTLKYKV